MAPASPWKHLAPLKKKKHNWTDAPVLQDSQYRVQADSVPKRWHETPVHSESDYQEKLTSGTGHSPAPVRFYTAFTVYAGKQKGRIHLMVLHEVPLSNFSPLTLAVSQSQSSESQFIQIPKRFGMESFDTSLTQQIHPGLCPKLREVYFPIPGLSCYKSVRGSFTLTAKSSTCFLGGDFDPTVRRGAAPLSPLLTRWCWSHLDFRKEGD